MFSKRAVAPLLLWLTCTGAAHGGIIAISPVTKDKVISPAANDKKKSDEAVALRNKARAYKSGNVQPMPPTGEPIIIQMDAESEIEEGVLLPRNDEIPAVSRARNHQPFRDNIPSVQDIQLDVPGTQPGTSDAAPADGQDTQKQLEKNRFKASQYMKGKPAPSSVSRNKDSHVVACESAGSVSGRIGDDSMSGREIIVIRDGKQIKMRCK